MVNENILKITYREDLKKYQVTIINGHDTISLFYANLESCFSCIRCLIKGLRGEKI